MRAPRTSHACLQRTTEARRATIARRHGAHRGQQVQTLNYRTTNVHSECAVKRYPHAHNTARQPYQKLGRTLGAESMLRRRNTEEDTMVDTISASTVEESMAKGWQLPAYLYSDSSVYELERELIFRRGWIYVGLAEKLEKPGDYFTAEVGDTPKE